MPKKKNALPFGPILLSFSQRSLEALTNGSGWSRRASRQAVEQRETSFNASITLVITLRRYTPYMRPGE
jgi:hypothetical protein